MACQLALPSSTLKGSVRTQSASRVASSKPRRGAAHDLPALSIDVYLWIVGRKVLHRQNQYLNNRIEQDHRPLKQRYYPMLGFGRFDSASRLTNINFLVDQQEVREVSGSRLFVYPDHVDSSTATVHGYPGVILAADPEAPYPSL